MWCGVWVCVNYDSYLYFNSNFKLNDLPPTLYLVTDFFSFGEMYMPKKNELILCREYCGYFPIQTKCMQHENKCVNHLLQGKVGQHNISSS